MTDADKIMHPQHFGTDLTYIWIRILSVILYTGYLTNVETDGRHGQGVTL